MVSALCCTAWHLTLFLPLDDIAVGERLKLCGSAGFWTVKMEVAGDFSYLMEIAQHSYQALDGGPWWTSSTGYEVNSAATPPPLAVDVAFLAGAGRSADPSADSKSQAPS